MITVYGDAILDVYQHVDHVKPSPESTGNVYRLTGNSLEYKLGGATAVAAICAGLDYSATCIAPIGADKKGQILSMLAGTMKGDWILPVINNRKTPWKLRYVCKGKLLPDRFDDQLYQAEGLPIVPENGTLVISDYKCGACANLSNMRGRCIIVDPAIDRNWVTAYKGAHIIKCNLLEAMQQAEFLGVSYYYDKIDLGSNLAVMFPNCYLIITDGPNDIGIYYPLRPSMSVGVPRVDRVIDPTGCGDTITAALACFLDTNKDKPLTIELIAQGCTYAAIRAAKQTQSIGVNYDNLV